MSESDSNSVTVHPYGPTLAYLESHISGNTEEYFDTLHQWVGLALDNPQHEREYDWEQYYPIGEDDGRILNATITLNGSFLKKYNYLYDYIKSAP